MIARILDWVKNHQHDIVMGFAMILVAWSFFNIGKLYSVTKEPIQLSQQESTQQVNRVTAPRTPLDVRVVVSKNSSSKKYHYSWCGSGNRIKEENRVWYESAALAETAGYTLAGNCK